MIQQLHPQPRDDTSDTPASNTCEKQIPVAEKLPSLQCPSLQHAWTITPASLRPLRKMTGCLCEGDKGSSASGSASALSGGKSSICYPKAAESAREWACVQNCNKNRWEAGTYTQAPTHTPPILGTGCRSHSR